MESDPLVTWVILSNLNITFLPISIATVAGFILTTVLLICSALVSGSEVAFFSLSPTDLEKINKSKTHSAKAVKKLLENQSKLLATILVANNFINIAIVILSTYITNSVIDFSNSPAIGFAVQVVIITFLLLLFGEIVPKVYANQFSSGFAQFMSFPILFLSKVFRPISYFLTASTKIVDKRVLKKQNISMDDLSNALEITSESITDDKEILKGIIEFGSIEVSEIMCSRVDIMSIDINSPFTNIIRQIIDAGYSRIPVYDGTFDNIKGVLYIKDLLSHIQKNDSFRWQSLIRPPYFIPEKKKINDLLEELQAKRIHMAIVVDEYGGTSGIITMEDILEEIVGEISDEFDADDVNFTKINDANYLFKGKTLLNDFYKILELETCIFDEIKGDADTLAGLILELKGEFPEVYDTIRYRNFSFKIEEIDKRRIKKIKTTINK